MCATDVHNNQVSYIDCLYVEIELYALFFCILVLPSEMCIGVR